MHSSGPKPIAIPHVFTVNVVGAGCVEAPSTAGGAGDLHPICLYLLMPIQQVLFLVYRFVRSNYSLVAINTTAVSGNSNFVFQVQYPIQL